MYSTAAIAKRLGCTVQAVNKYRRKIEKRDSVQLGTPDPTDARRTLFTQDEVALIAEMAPKIPVTEPEVEILDGDDTHRYVGNSTTSLALRHSTLPTVQRQRYDLATAQEEVAAIEQHTLRTITRGDSLLSEFAQFRMMQAVQNINQSIATMEANALGDAVATLGKPIAAGGS